MARITIAGGHGQVALLLARRLADRGDEVTGIIRHPDQAGDLREHGSEPALLDLEEASTDELADVVGGSDAVVFAAGAGPGSGAARKHTVDYGGAAKLVEAAEMTGINRYVMVSAMGTDDPPEGDDVFEVYLQAKARADRLLAESDLAWTIVRPGSLTDDEPTGRVSIGRHLETGEVPRGDVAAVLAACLADDRTVGRVFEITAGDDPIDEALDDLGEATRTPPQ